MAMRNEKTPTIGAGAVQGEERAAPYSRIVSLAPSITEDLYVLGLMDRVVGVTRYCNFPAEAQTKVRIGGYYDPNYEMIVSLEPDLIIMLAEHQEPRERFSRLGIDIVTVEHKSIEGILRSIETIGEACGVLPKAKSVTKRLRERMARIQEKTRGHSSPRVMVSIGRNMGTGELEDVYISGRDGFYNEMIERLGGANAYPGKVASPVVSYEGILEMNPDVIIDIVPDLKERGWSPEQIYREWDAVCQVNAVRDGRVHVFGEDYVAVPGPRFITIMEKMARAMYPDVNWD